MDREDPFEASDVPDPKDSSTDQPTNPTSKNPLKLISNIARFGFQKSKDVGSMAYNKISEQTITGKVSDNAKYIVDRAKEQTLSAYTSIRDSNLTTKVKESVGSIATKAKEVR